MRSKDIIKRIERLGGCVVARAGKGSHTKKGGR
jgi:predicted RNA binding protein YcfA (HicA-like mRNA interferase family)